MGARRLLPLLVVACASGLVATGAGAEVPDGRGWWTIAGEPPLVEVASADVPEGGLLIQGSSDDPIAFGALTFDLSDGREPLTLTLSVVPESVSTPTSTLLLCSLTSPFDAADGGPIDDAPSYDCDGAIDAEPDESGSYTWDVSSLPSGTELAVAVLGTGPADRVVIAPPGLDTLQVTSSSVVAPPTTPPVASSAPSAGDSTVPPLPSSGAATPAPPGLLLGPTTGQAAPIAPSAPSISGPTAPLPFTPVESSTSAAANMAAVALLFLLAVSAGTTWVLAGNDSGAVDAATVARDVPPT